MVKSTQVWRRAKQQGIGQAQVADLVKTADENMAKLSNLQNGQHNQKDIVFSGGLLSELAATLHDDSHIIVKSTDIKIDKALQLHANNISIDFGKAKLSPTKDYLQGLPQQNYNAAIQVIDAKGVTIEGGVFDGLEAIVTAHSSAVTITHIAVKGFKGYGVIVGPDSSAVAISNSDFVGGVASAIAVLQKTENVLIKQNIIRDGTGGSNQHAGILVTDRRKYTSIGGPDFLLAATKLQDGKAVYHGVADDPIVQKTTPPKNIYIVANQISKNLSSGIYVDGATLTYIASNSIVGNSKEGLCLDNGATGNVVVDNKIESNGARWGKTDLDLSLDFVLRFGRSTDGSANAKLPGISVDNAVLNIISSNHIAKNAGSGIKLVRTGYYNIIGHNLIADNNAGANKKFFFFGIELGGAPADNPVSDLDFQPSMGNIIFQNVITGSHYSGIQFCPKCEFNDVFDNTIINPNHWAIEQNAKGEKNIFNNNFSQQKSRNANLNGTSGKILIGGDDIED